MSLGNFHLILASEVISEEASPLEFCLYRFKFPTVDTSNKRATLTALFFFKKRENSPAAVDIPHFCAVTYPNTSIIRKLLSLIFGK